MDNTVGKQIFQEISEIPIFNVIGAKAKIMNYDDVSYFKVKMPKLVEINDEFEFEYEFMHYIHIKENGELKVSIYFDKCDLGGVMGVPYYELYDTSDVIRFVENDKEELNLYDRTVGLLDREKSVTIMDMLEEWGI